MTNVNRLANTHNMINIINSKQTRGKSVFNRFDLEYNLREHIIYKLIVRIN